MSKDKMLEAAGNGRLHKSAAGALTAACDGEDTDESHETVFGELQPPNIHSEPFPQRLLHWKPGGKAEPPSAASSIIVTQEVLESVNRHVSQDLKRELGGFLLGNRYICPNSKRHYIRIDVCTEARFASGTSVSMEMVNETFLHLIEELSGKHRGKEVLGWYHSHPKNDVFLSPDDIRVHEDRFKQDWAVALVVNPNQNIGAFFRRHEGVLESDSTTDFYELLGIGTPTTTTCVPWVNQVCYDPRAGRRISPRLAPKENQSVSTDGPAAQPPTPPPRPSSVWWLSLPQAKVAAGILGALMFGVILYALLRTNNTRVETPPPAKPDAPEVARIDNETQPQPPPGETPAAAQAQTAAPRESNPTRESESAASNAGGSRKKKNRRAQAAAAATTNDGNSSRRGNSSAGAGGAAAQTKPQRQSPAPPTARSQGAFGGPD